MKRRLRVAITISAILLSACGSATPATPTPDVNAIYTAAAKTVVAELTQTAAVITPTLQSTATQMPASPAATVTTVGTPLPTETPQPTPTLFLEASPTQQFCDDAKHVADVNVRDGTEMSPGQDFLKTWRIKNTGTCLWGAGYGPVYGYGPKMGGQPIALTTTVNPGEEVEVSIQFKAPDTAGEYKSYWRMENANGAPFGEFFYVQIVVR